MHVPPFKITQLGAQRVLSSYIFFFFLGGWGGGVVGKVYGFRVEGSSILYSAAVNTRLVL